MNTQVLTKPEAKKGALHQGFAREFAKLNPNQRLAVETIEGPLLVVAGPGTGKTQVIGMRVANILNRTQMRPGNILCLTFSKSGATAMRKRLRKLIGSDAYRVTVNTIHGFCNEIIGAHPHVFEQWNAMSPIGDIEKYKEMNKIIDQKITHSELLSKKYPYQKTKDILSRISQLKREGAVDPAFLEEVAKKYENEMAGKSREGTKAHEKNLLAARKFRDFLDLFASYQEMLRTKGKYDYDDMILRVIDALKEEDWLLASVQERYQYILVDEFQDTNGAQYALIDLLSRDPTGDNKANICVVGDDDQAIYRFQGANLTNILSFRAAFPSAPIVTLTQSYRCTQPILDAAENLISQNTERLVSSVEGLTKHLTAVTQEQGTPPYLALAPSDTVEPWVIADLIEKRMQEGIPLEEIAVLVQTNRELSSVHEVLRARDIPVQMSGKLDLLTNPVVCDLIAVLKAVHKPEDSSALASALSLDCFHCNAADLARVFRERRSLGTSLQNVLLDLEQAEWKNALQGVESILHARDILLDLYHKSSSRTLLHTVEHALKDTSLLKDIDAEAMDIINFASVHEFFERIKERTAENPAYTFSDFLEDLSYYENPDFGDLRMSYDLPHLSSTGVQLMTAHKSKGLEFHTVILANFREGHWDSRRNPSMLSVPEDLLFGWQKDQKNFEQSQDERRVAFVAMTRAKRELIFTCPKELSSGDSLKSVSVSAFFAESGNLEEQEVAIESPEKLSILLKAPRRELREETKAFLRERLEDFALSPSALNDFLDGEEGPQKFLERHLLMIPEAKDPKLAYGNAVHHALAKWALRKQAGEAMSKDDMLTLFKAHLEEREMMTSQEQVRFDILGTQTISRYFDSVLSGESPHIFTIEHGIATHLGDIPIKGKIDRIDTLEPDSKIAIVYDYKTGKPKTPKQLEDYGYNRQLAFYALLIEQSTLPITPSEFVLEFLGEEAEGPMRRSMEIGETQKSELRNVITNVWEKIQNLDFTPLEKDS